MAAQLVGLNAEGGPRHPLQWWQTADGGVAGCETGEVTTFSFATAGQVLFGPGRARELSKIVAGLGDRVFVCTGSRPERHAHLLEGLGPAVATFPIAHEPTIELVRDAAAAAADHDANVVVGLGGGSVVDAAKAVAALVANGGDPLDYAEVIGKGQPLTKRSLPCVAVPTTAGTGSEVTANAVVASLEHGVKVSLRSTSMLPTVALVDPELTLDCPAAVTASAGLDALTQCIEPLVSPFGTPVTDQLCREGLRRAASGLRRAYADGGDLDARTDMSLCSLFSGMSLANAKLGAVHGFAGPLGGMMDAAHGAICAALLPAVCRANIAALKQRDPENPALARYDEVGELLTGAPRAEAAIAWITETVELLGVPGIGQLGLDAERIDEACEKAARASSMKGNPIELAHAELRAILEQSW